MGESLYNPMLPGIVVDSSQSQRSGSRKRRATVVFLDEFKNKEGEPWARSFRRKMAAIYTTTDIACGPNIVMKHACRLRVNITSTPVSINTDAGMGDRP
ncbi:arginine--tRNA ligase [Shigella flexneri]